MEKDELGGGAADSAVGGAGLESGAGSEPARAGSAEPEARPHSTIQEYHRVMFLARLVLGFTILAALTLGIIAFSTGRNYESIAVGLILVAGAGAHYAWVRRAVRRDLVKATQQCATPTRG